MGLLQLVLLLLYAIGLARSLPITSTPLEDNPDHLANWDAHLTFADNRNYGGYEYEYEVRKIPKSIFITPHLNESTCPPGYRLANDGKCRPENNINLDPEDILKTQLLAFLGQSTNSKPAVEYNDDYEYDESPQENQKGPYHVPLSVSFGDSAPLTGSSSSSSPFRTDASATNDDHHLYKDATRPDVVVVVSSTTANSGKRASESFTRSTEPLHTIYISSSTPLEPDYETDDMEMAASTYRPTYLSFADWSTTGHTPTAIDKDNNTIVAITTESTPNTLGTSRLDEELTSTLATPTTDATVQHSTEVLSAGHSDTNADRQLQFELQSESLFQEESEANVLNITVASGSGDGAGTTTELIDDMEAVASTPIVNTLSATLSERIATTNEVTAPIRPSTTPTVETVIVMAQAPTTDRVQIVTAVEQQDPRPDPELSVLPTDPFVGELHTHVDDTDQSKRMREAVRQHELNEDAIETTDQHNRFVYNHLGSPQTNHHHHHQPHHRHHTSTSMVAAAPPVTTPMPPMATTRSFIDQLRLYSKFTEENRRNQPQQRLRYPQSASPPNVYSNYRGSTIKFPGPVTGETGQRRFHTGVAAENQPKKPFASSTPAPQLFSWLPNWSYDRSGVSASSDRPVRFWDKIPLMSDPTYNNGADGTDRTRANSKSPTDSMYKDLPTASEIYKVLTAKNSKYNDK